MKMKKQALFSLLALVLCLVMVLPILAGCAEEENPTTTVEIAPPVVEETPRDPNYIPPENYMDFSDSAALESTPNANGGNKVTSATQQQKPTYKVETVDPNYAGVGAGNNRREVALAKMREMLTVRWTPKKTISYSYNAGAYGLTSDGKKIEKKTAAFALDNVTLTAGKVYQGLPYALGSGSLEAFLVNCQEEDGVYTVPLTVEALSGTPTYYSRLGVDGVDALAWAWSAASNKTNFTEVKNMIAKRGVQWVEGFEISEKTVTETALIDGSTMETCTLNGAEKMYAAYANVKKADAFITNVHPALGEHAAMVVSIQVVENADGTINGAESTVTVLEQTPAGLLTYAALSDAEKEALADQDLVVGGIDVTYTFEELFAVGALPVTCPDFHHDQKLDTVWTYAGYNSTYSYTKSSVFAGFVQASRRLAYVRLNVKDAEGKTMFEVFALPAETGLKENYHHYAISTLDDTDYAPLRRGVIDTSLLIKGNTYTATAYGLLSTGEEVVLREFSAKW